MKELFNLVVTHEHWILFYRLVKCGKKYQVQSSMRKHFEVCIVREFPTLESAKFYLKSIIL